MIFCNGCPKTGTNLARKLCGALGFEDSGYAVVRLTPFAPIGARRTLGEAEAAGKTPFEAKTFVAPEPVFADRAARVVHGHVVGVDPWPFASHRMILTLRDPRDAAVSYVRWLADRYGAPADRATLTALLEGRINPLIHPWAELFHLFGAFRDAPFCRVIRFDEFDDPERIAEIAAFLGAECDAARIAAGLYGDGKNFEGRPMYKARSSWTGEWSRWRDWWDDGLQRVWEATRGPELARPLGYETGWDDYRRAA